MSNVSESNYHVLLVFRTAKTQFTIANRNSSALSRGRKASSGNQAEPEPADANTITTHEAAAA